MKPGNDVPNNVAPTAARCIAGKNGWSLRQSARSLIIFFGEWEKIGPR